MFSYTTLGTRPRRNPRRRGGRARGAPRLALAAALLPLAVPASVAAAPPVPVSPGGAGGGSTAEACPTFLWSAGDGDGPRQLIVYPLDAEGELGSAPALTQRLPAGAQGWTPPADRCLEAGVRYAWVVREPDATSQARHDWSGLAVFEVTSPSRADVAAALETLRRYLAAAPGETDALASAARDLGELGTGLARDPGRLLPGRSINLPHLAAAPRAEGEPAAALGARSGHLGPPSAIRAIAPGPADYGVWGEVEVDGGLVPTGSGAGVAGYAKGSLGQNHGVVGASDSSEGRGVLGMGLATTGQAVGVYGESSSSEGVGILGSATDTGGATIGVLGTNPSTLGIGVVGSATATSGGNHGVRGETDSTEGFGVAGVAKAETGSAFGVFGYSESSTGYAGFFNGRVHVTGELSKGSGSFLIDHPLDPANRTLSHSFVESPDMMNVYNGNVVLDTDGAAWVELPEYFGALNREFRYQLTALDRAAPGLHVSQRIAGNRFRVAGGEPRMEVSWQVTGIRQDAYAQTNPVVVEQDKGEHRGRYFHPVAHGQPPELAMHYVAPPRTQRSRGALPSPARFAAHAADQQLMPNQQPMRESDTSCRAARSSSRW